MAAKNTISQLDLVLLGRRGLTARIGSVEGQVKRLVTGTGGAGAVVADTTLRPNLFTNSSFEFYNRNSTAPQGWTAAGGAYVSVGSAGADGTNSLLLPAGASASQVAADGVTIPHSSVVISVAARTITADQKISIGLTHTPGYEAGSIIRIDQAGQEFTTDDVPSDGLWYRFYRQFILTGGATATGSILQAGSGTLEVDAAKFEKEDGVASWLAPTAYISADWGAATHIRNLAADNIIAGTLIVGGSSSSNPRISVLDGSDTEIVVIGNPVGGYYGVEIKGAAGLKISGSGSAQISGGGGLDVLGGGDISVSGGDVLISGTGKVMAGTAGAQRTELNASGLSGYNASNIELVRVDAADGKLKVLGSGGLYVSGSGGILVDGGGSVAINGTGSLSVGGTFTVSGTSTLGGDLTLNGNLLMGSGLMRIGISGGKRIVMAASGIEAYDVSNNRTMFLDVDTATWRFFGQNSVVLEGNGSIKAGALAWIDTAGFWATDYLGNAAFGVSGVDTHLWGGVTMDKGDVLIGDSVSHLLWDDSLGKVTLTGEISAAQGNVLIWADGINLQPGNSSRNRIQWATTPGADNTTTGKVEVNKDTGTNTSWMDLYAYGNTLSAGHSVLWEGLAFSTGATGEYSKLYLEAKDGDASISKVKMFVGNTAAAKSFTFNNVGFYSDVGIHADLNTTMGKHPYHTTYSALYKDNSAGEPGYAMRWDATDTFINAASTSGTLYLRHGNLATTQVSIDSTGTITTAGGLKPEGLTSGYYGAYNSNTPYIRGSNVVMDGGLYMGGQTTYNMFQSGSVLTASASFRATTNLYLGGSQTGRYFHDDGSYTRFAGNLVVDGDLFFNSAWASTLINQAVLTSSAPQFNGLNLVNSHGNYLKIYQNYVGAQYALYLESGEAGYSFSVATIGHNWVNNARVDTAVGAVIQRLNVSGAWTLLTVDSSGTSVNNIVTDISSGAARIGFLGASQVARQTGGAATADTTWSQNEVDMLNRAYTALRNYGLLT